MGGADIGALCQRLGADDGQSDGLIPIVVVNFVAGLCIHAGDKGLEAALFRLGNGPGSCFTLGLAVVHESHVIPAIRIHFFALRRADTGKTVLGGGKQGLAQFISGHGFILLYRFSFIIPNVFKKAIHFARNSSWLPSFSSTWLHLSRNQLSGCWARMRARA